MYEPGVTLFPFPRQLGWSILEKHLEHIKPLSPSLLLSANMQTLEQYNATKDFEVLQLIPARKMVVKRPIKAEPFSFQTNYQVSGKTTRFDIYI